MVVPGLIDAHVHPRAAVLAQSGPDLSACRTAASALARLSERLAEGAAGPVLGFGWNDVSLPPAERIDRRVLDRLGADRPIVLYHPSLHTAVVNSPTLAEIGLTDGSPDPTGGRLGRSAGELDGRLFEGALRALAPLERQAFALQRDGVRGWLRGAAALGLTTVSAMGIDPEDLDHLRRVADPGAPRIRAYLPLRSQAELPSSPRSSPDELVRSVGLKLHLDGALGPRTAWLSQPYQDDPRTSGAPGLSTGELAEILADAGAQGYQVALHAIGDGALRVALRSVRREASSATVRIEHASLTPASLLSLLAELRVPVAVQPLFRSSDDWLADRLGPERAEWAYAYRSLTDVGVSLAGSSDAPVERMDPWAGMAAAIAPRAGGRPGQELSPTEALGLYTTGGGQVLREPALGSLEPGAFADLVVLDVPTVEEAIRHGAAAVRSTYRGGEATYTRSAG